MREILEHLAFIQAQRVARLATADQTGQPHLIPVCYACDGSRFYIALDTKPKRVAPQRLKRIRNILANPQVALLIDHYSEDWSALAYILVRGSASLIEPSQTEHGAAVQLLREKYDQYKVMPIHEQPVIAIQPVSVVVWGNVMSDEG